MSKELFLKYEQIRASGKHNMLMDAAVVMSKMKLNPRHKSDCSMYLDIVKNYAKYADMWLKE